VGIEPSGHASRPLRGGTVLVDKGVGPLDQALGMAPARAIAVELELAGIVAHQDGVLE
jgi:hypothetical protein